MHIYIIYQPKQIQQGPQTSFVLVKTSNADEQIICQVNIHIGWAKSFSKATKWLLLLTSPSLSHDPLQATGCADPNRRGEPQDPNTQSGQTRLLLKTDLLCGAIIVCGHICFTFLHCVFSNVSLNCMHEKRHSHIGCICLTVLHCVFSNVSSNGMPAMKLHWLHLFDFSPLWVFICVLKLNTWEDA